MNRTRRLTFTLFMLALAASPLILNGQPVRKIVLIAGVKTHGPGEHEYFKTVRLIKVMLDQALAVKGIKTEIHSNGWPLNPATLDDADVIMFYADGSDDREDHDPMLAGDHLKVIEKQIRRGCGLVLLHYSTFAPAKYGSRFLDWTGGYFDYENGKPGATGQDAWYSAIKTATARVLPAAGHPIAEGVSSFDLHEEFYYNIRFQEKDPDFKPVLKVMIPGVAEEQTIAWTVERKGGSRGFGFTGGHYFDNLNVPAYRKLLLNAILWTAHAKIPKGGVTSQHLSDAEVDGILENR